MIEKQIQQDLVSAMKMKQEHTVAALRSVKAAIQNEKVNGEYHELTDNDIVKLIQKLVKQRKESMDIYSQAKRHDLADAEQQEMFVLMNYLPKMLSKEELTEKIVEIINENNYSSIKDMGKVMASLKEKYPNLYDGKEASEIIKSELNK